MENEISFKESRIKAMTQLYYSNKEVQQAIFEFSKNREISPRYYEGFGKRPDSFQFVGDVFELVKKGATSFHCSEEIWENPLEINAEMTPKEYDEIRTGWDLLIDIDCPWIEYSKLAAIALINVFQKHGISTTSIGIKFSGSKGFHLLLPWKTFPKEIAGNETKNLFPELPRKLVAYLRNEARKEIEKLLPSDFYKQFKDVEISRGIICKNCGSIAKEYEFLDLFCSSCSSGEQKKVLKQDTNKNLNCPNCRKEYSQIDKQAFFYCDRCNLSSKETPSNFSTSNKIDLFELMGLDLVLVSPRHLFRMPYSLHEKTSLSSIVLDFEELKNFELKDADPLKVKIKDFSPECKEGEAKNFVINALEWASENIVEESKKVEGKYADYKPIKLENLTQDQFPPCVLKILQGLKDGRKRALFVLINLFRSIGLEKEELEKKIFDWNEKNSPPLKVAEIKAQLTWTYRRKPLMPKNCRDFYKELGVCFPDQICSKIKNPVNYVLKKNYFANPNKKETKKKKKTRSSRDS
jgi:hypothetical protein